MKRAFITICCLLLFALPLAAQQGPPNPGQGGSCGPCSENAFAVMDSVFRSCLAQNGPGAYQQCHQQAATAACQACVQNCSPCQICVAICLIQ